MKHIVFTASFMKTVPSMYTLLMKTIYLFRSTQVADVTVFRKHTVMDGRDGGWECLYKG